MGMNLKNPKTIQELHHHIPGSSSALGHKKSTFVDKHAPDAIATAVTATCVMADATAACDPDPATAAAAAITFPEPKIAPNDDTTFNFDTVGPKTHRNLAEFRTLLRNGWDERKIEGVL